MDLKSKTCKVCESNEFPITFAEAGKLFSQISGWSMENSGKILEKEFTFNNFKNALSFINKVGELAESEGHHPDILLHDYKKVRIILSTHVIKGLSENDFILAAKIDDI